MREIKLKGCEYLNIVDRYINGYETASVISKDYNVHRNKIVKFLKLCNVEIRKKGPSSFHMDDKKCKDCCRLLSKKDNFKQDKLGLYYARCFKCHDAYRASKYAEDKDSILARKKELREANLEKTREKYLYYKRKYKEEGRVFAINKDLRKASLKKYRAKESSKAKKREYMAKRAKEMTPSQKMCENVKKIVYNTLKRKKNGRTFDLLGYTSDALISHIESLFVDGMTWDNYGVNGWHLDHIIPRAYFDLENTEEFKKAWSLDNLQPLWASENSSKGSLYNGIRHFYNK